MAEAGEADGGRTVSGDGMTLGGIITSDTGMIDAVDLPIIIISRDCRVARINRAATMALGLTASNIGCSLGDILAGVENLDRLCAQVIADGAPCRLETRDGDRTFLLRIAPYVGGDRQILGAVLTFTNVTAFRASIHEAIYEREYTKAILNSVIDPLVVLNTKLLVQTGNRAFYALFGLSRDETQGVSIRKLGNKDWETSEVWKSMETSLSDCSQFQAMEIETVFRGTGSRTVVVEPCRLERDGVALILLTFHDVTGRKQAEQARLENELSARFLQVQDEERRRIARELHDGVGQLLAAISMNVSPIVRERSKLSEATAQAAGEISSLAARASAEIRTVSYLLHPPMLDEIGLHTALKWYIAGFAERSKIKVAMDLASELPRLSHDYELSLFRIAQECLMNIHRHSGSFTASVRLSQMPAKIELEVRDEGKGIGHEMVARLNSGASTGVGFRGMQERVRLIGGQLTIHSNGHGTSVLVSLPINEAALPIGEATPHLG
jgi:PAS domain S-box-containing protein